MSQKMRMWKVYRVNQFEPIVDACTLCDMCFMTKCPYVPPHEFDLDFPHLMLRYRTAQKKLNKLPVVPAQLAQIDRNAKVGSYVITTNKLGIKY